MNSRIMSTSLPIHASMINRSWYQRNDSVEVREIENYINSHKVNNMETAVTETVIESEVVIPMGDIQLRGQLNMPENTTKLVIFSHGSGSSHLSPRNRYVANTLNDRGVGTLLFDLLTPEEDEVYENRFDIDLLTSRMLYVTAWILEQPGNENLNVGYFGASTGAASALNAAAVLDGVIGAVVCRGGRTDLATMALDKITAAVQLIVGEEDTTVLEFNQQTYHQLVCEKDLDVIAGATHLFEEPGKLEEVAKTSADWFARHLD